ncbi:MAG: hypothetical protein HY850_10565 [Betaproteobacteria bacterium]|nr:hypothetical protein [Betaproteobacteria bacterium]
MHRLEECRFCHILAGQQFNGSVDKPIDVCDDYISMASIGALIEGWSLVVPREHCLSLRDHYKSSTFFQFVQSNVQNVERQYGPAIIFEHGANHHGSLTSCGTDHAHLHIVPQPFPINAMLENSGISGWQKIPASQIQSAAHDAEYLFLSTSPLSNDPIGFFKIVDTPTSQFFRHAIAATLGKTATADYKQHPHLDVSTRTGERLRRAA